MRRTPRPKSLPRRGRPPSTTPDGRPSWPRDAAFDGHFLYSVETTGIYCRPSCAARRPKRDHVRFHDTAADAEPAGFRPCKRCKPDEPSLCQQHAEKVREACRLIETAEEAPKLDDLAAAVGLSPYHFHRIFKAVLGVTPKAYAIAHRNKRVRDELGRSATVTEAIYDAGFNSNGRFYATSSEVLGMTPTDFRSGGANAEIKFAIGQCSLGAVLVASSDKGVCAILFGDDPRPCSRPPEAVSPRPSGRRRPGVRAARLPKVIAFVEDPRAGLRPSLGHPRHRLSAPRVGRAPPHSGGQHGELRGDRRGHRRAESGARGGVGLRLEPHRRGDPLSPRGQDGRRRCPAIAAASSASARCWPRKPNRASGRGAWRRDPGDSPASARPCSRRARADSPRR